MWEDIKDAIGLLAIFFMTWAALVGGWVLQ